jgi:hypothetical protein
MFAHSVSTRANKVKFQHQALCNPKISRLLKATRKGFLKGCPYISEELILKYLNPSPATAKGCMKRPRYGIKSTTPKRKNTAIKSPPQKKNCILSYYLQHLVAHNSLPLREILSFPPA